MENICDWKNCKNVAFYKAPIEKDNSKEYRLLCSMHIKEFNKSWDYFDGMSEHDIECFIKSDQTWHRSTQKFDSPDNFFNILWNNAINDNFNLFENVNKNNQEIKKNLSIKDKDAFKAMDLKVDSGWTIIQKKFKTLVKMYHPDMNAGNKEFENKLKSITLAYSHLKLIFKNKK
ncbi:MAG: molecular chaperone DnaJ [Candidatus Pelagibacter sp. TMED64]|nr:molecular chaperone DnaJ [Candidatus Pelagibacter sp.]OUU66237.1 MAG: molecular chaperone DnaJ [Candidatus Pelagibacter sp. TMED64]|tara:strand:+ start:2145 stop:2666 length:522 start_codon:yes stop_codon:yes gene_type:complete